MSKTSRQNKTKHQDAESSRGKKRPFDCPCSPLSPGVASILHGGTSEGAVASVAYARSRSPRWKPSPGRCLRSGFKEQSWEQK